MTVTVKVNSKGVEAYIKRVMKDMPKELDRALYKTAQQGINVIQNRTEKGAGTNGRFAPYTQDYEKWKSKYVKNWQGLVDLTVSGEMLAAMTASKPKNHRSRLGFTNREDAAKALGNHRRRRFFELNDKEIDRLGAFFKKELFR